MKINVLFVCTGNICRSPTAEGLMRAHVERAGLSEHIHIDSAGTHNYHGGDPPDARSIETAQRMRGIDLSTQRARKVAAGDFQHFDYVVALDLGHHDILMRQAPAKFRDRVAPLMSFVPGAKSMDVPDPYYGGPEGFERVLEMIESGIVGLLDHIKRTHLVGSP